MLLLRARPGANAPTLLAGILTLRDLTDPAQVRTPDWTALAALDRPSRPRDWWHRMPHTRQVATKLTDRRDGDRNRFHYGNGGYAITARDLDATGLRRAVLEGSRIIGWRPAQVPNPDAGQLGEPATLTVAEVVEQAAPLSEYAAELAYSFSTNPATPHVLWILGYDYGGGRVRIGRYNTTTRQIEGGEPIPGGWTPWMPWTVERSAGWLHVSADETVFSFQELTAASGQRTRCAIWRAGATALTELDTTGEPEGWPNELKLNPEGTHVLFADDRGAKVQVLATGQRFANQTQEAWGGHSFFGDDLWIPFGSDNPESMGALNVGTGQILRTANPTHPTANDPGALTMFRPEYRVGGWRQPGAPNDRRFLLAVNYDHMRVYAPNGGFADQAPWAAQGGGVYRATGLLFDRDGGYATRGRFFGLIYDFTANPRRVVGSCVAVDSSTGMPPGSVYADAATGEAWVRMPDDGTPNRPTYGLSIERATAGFDVLAFVSYDGSVRRLLGHTYNDHEVQDYYAHLPQWQVSADGRWVVGGSNSGVQAGPVDLYAIATPTA